MYRSLTLVIAAALMAPLTEAMAAVHMEAGCSIDSSYDLSIEPQQLKFTRQNGTGVVVFTQGQIYVDGAALKLDAADSERVAQFERDVRALVPEVKQIASDGVEIAFTALNRVIDTFASAANQAAFRADLATLHSEIVHAIDSANSTREFDEQAFEAKIETMVEGMVPRLAAEFASAAVSAALSGDEAAAKAIEAKAEQMGKDIEASVQVPAKALEARFQALCPRVEALDRLESELDVRLPDGQSLDLLKVDNQA